MPRVIVVPEDQQMEELLECAAPQGHTVQQADLTAIVCFEEGSDFLRRVQQVLIALCAAGDYCLDNVCAELKISRPTLYRRIKKETGLSPGTLARTLRLEIAACLIAAGHSVTEGALAMGFESVSHFSRAFRDHFGVAPSRLAECARRAPPDTDVETAPGSPTDLSHGGRVRSSIRARSYQTGSSSSRVSKRPAIHESA